MRHLLFEYIVLLYYNIDVFYVQEKTAKRSFGKFLVFIIDDEKLCVIAKMAQFFNLSALIFCERYCKMILEQKVQTKQEEII